jgi:hypothetical protein
MSIVKVGILVAIVVAVLPADKEQQARLYDRAATAVHWTATFCDRNGPTCVQAKDLWSAFLQKAQFGAQMAYELALRHYSKDQAPGSGIESSPIAPAVQSSGGTLTPQDLKPTWRGNTGPNGV